MNIDALKFSEVFIDLIDNGKIANSPHNIEYRLEHCDEYYDKYKNNWINFLTAKLDELDEDYDEWYENLTFDDITGKEKSTYHLPFDKFEVKCDNLTYFSEIVNYCKDVYSSANTLITNNNYFIIQCDINTRSILLEVMMFNNSDKDTYNKLRKTFDTAANNVAALLRKFEAVDGTVSHNVNLIMTTSQSLAKIDPKSPEEENEERRAYKKMFEDNNIKYFKRIQVTPSSFVWARGKTREGDIEDYMNKIFDTLPEFNMCNNPDGADKYLGLV